MLVSLLNHAFKAKHKTILNINLHSPLVYSGQVSPLAGCSGEGKSIPVAHPTHIAGSAGHLVFYNVATDMREPLLCRRHLHWNELLPCQLHSPAHVQRLTGQRMFASQCSSSGLEIMAVKRIQGVCPPAAAWVRSNALDSMCDCH